MQKVLDYREQLEEEAKVDRPCKQAGRCAGPFERLKKPSCGSEDRLYQAALAPQGETLARWNNT